MHDVMKNNLNMIFAPSIPHFPDASPAASPYQLQPTPSQTVTELAAKAPFLDLAPRVKNLGFPASCNFVLNLLDRYDLDTLCYVL